MNAHNTSVVETIRIVSYNVICSLILSVTLCGDSNTDQTVKSRTNKYRNIDYLYAVSLTSKVQIETNEPPNPNHGFIMKFAPSTHLWVDASSSDDTSLRAAVASEVKLWADHCRPLTSGDTVLGLLRASRISLECAAESENQDPSTVTIVFALRSDAPRRGRILYQVGMQCPLIGDARTRAEEAFAMVLKGFVLLRK